MVPRRFKFDSVCSFYFRRDVLFMQTAFKEGTLNATFWEGFVSKCDELAEVHWGLAEGLNQVLRCVLALGTLLNLVSILVLASRGSACVGTGRGTTQGIGRGCRLGVGPGRTTSTDIYLLSISLGDLTICVSSIISTQLPVGLGGIYVVCLGQIFGNIGGLIWKKISVLTSKTLIK